MSIDKEKRKLKLVYVFVSFYHHSLFELGVDRPRIQKRYCDAHAISQVNKSSRLSYAMDSREGTP